jgi:hypothetical protein
LILEIVRSVQGIDETRFSVIMTMAMTIVIIVTDKHACINFKK